MRRCVVGASAPLIKIITITVFTFIKASVVKLHIKSVEVQIQKIPE